MRNAEEQHEDHPLQAQPAVFPGFAVLEFRCARCGCEWVGVAAVGTMGLRCPKCDVYDASFEWLGPKPWTPHDGAWLTGSWLLPWWGDAHGASPGQNPTGSAACEDDEIDRTTGEPRAWLKRWLQRLQAAWWALRGEF